MKQFLLPLFIFAAVSTGVVLLVREPQPLPNLGIVQSAEFIDQSGRVVQTSDLRGVPSVWSFFFTSCQGPCPAVQSAVVQLQRSLGSGAKVRFVSVSIDPATDTPEAMTEYSRKIGASLDNWSFVRADESVVADFAKESFHAGVDTKQLVHTTRLALADSRGRVRGLYDPTDSEAMDRLRQDVKRAAEED